MSLVCLGLSHHTAPVEVRERHAFPPDRLGEALQALRDYDEIREAAILQTCGRLEIYAEVGEYEEGIGQLKRFLTNFRHGATGYDMESYLYTLLGNAVVEHLLRVSTGLDSMLVGEAEILGQVKGAYVLAQRTGTLGAVLHRLFRNALHAGKRARSTTAIGRHSASIATAAIELADDRLQGIAAHPVLVLGAGPMGRSALHRLRELRVADVAIASRRPARAQALAAEMHHGRAIKMQHLAEAIARADAVLTSTGATHFILTKENVGAAMRLRGGRPLLIVDIAVPRDADPAVAEIPGVTLLDIDDVKAHVEAKLEARKDAVPHVEAIIAAQAHEFARWYRSRAAVPLIASLTNKAEAIRAAEVERLFARCPDLTERERTLITGMSMTIVSKLLHGAIERLRERALDDRPDVLAHARVLDELFGLDVADQVARLLSRRHTAPDGQR